MKRRHKSRTRRIRRATRAILRHGPTAKPKHKSRSGRTGSIAAKQLAGRLHHAERDREIDDKAQ